MATYEQYPTPPPTSSPKHSSQSYHPFSPKLAAQDSYYQETQPSAVQKLPAQDTYYQATQSSTVQNRPAQDTYYQQTQSYSTPVSPKHSPYNPTTQTEAYLPPRRKSSPSNNPYYNPTITKPLSRPSSRPRTPPRPLHFSPLNPPPTPYSTARPQPRPGFLSKISAWLRKLLKWAGKNPIKAGLASFLPVLAGAGLIRAAKVLGLGKIIGSGLGLGGLIGAVMEGMGGGKGKKTKEEKEEEKKEWGWGMDHFVGFGGTKNGPLDGIMKVLLMGVNHYCKLTPSAVPRAASILLELYFLEVKK